MYTQLTTFRTGTTGYIGGDAFYALHEKFPDFDFTALVRNSDSGAKVAAKYPKIRLVYGTLEDSDVVEAEAAKADIVIRKFLISRKQCCVLISLSTQTQQILLTTKEQLKPSERA